MKRQLILTALALVLLMGGGCAMDQNMTHVKVGMSVRWKDRVRQRDHQHQNQQTHQVRQERRWEPPFVRNNRLRFEESNRQR